MSNEVLAVIYMRGLLSSLFVVAGMVALFIGGRLYERGSGFAKDGTAVRINGDKIAVTASLKTVGAVVMLTSVAWGTLAYLSIPQISHQVAERPTAQRTAGDSKASKDADGLLDSPIISFTGQDLARDAVVGESWVANLEHFPPKIFYPPIDNCLVIEAKVGGTVGHQIRNRCEEALEAHWSDGGDSNSAPIAAGGTLPIDVGSSVLLACQAGDSYNLNEEKCEVTRSPSDKKKASQ